MSGKVTNGGCAVSIALTFVFVALKLFNAIDWSWWWVLSPIWIGSVLVFLWIAIVIALAVFGTIWMERKK